MTTIFAPFLQITPAEFKRATEVTYLGQVYGTLAALKRMHAGLSLFSAGVMGGITLYQLGMLKHIPEPRWPRFNAEKVNGSAEAYAHLATPDSLLGLVNYGITACLAGAGAQSRWKTRPWIPLGVAGKVIMDAMLAGKLTVDQWRKYRTFCFWCLLTTAATFATLPLAASEAKAALDRLAGVGHG